MPEEPIVSVLMTAYNREIYIKEAIESVLASTYTNFELIVVDDCSTDRTLEVARSFIAKDHRVKVFLNKVNLGDYPNRNKAASLAQGKYIKFVDSDDLIYPHGLEVFVTSMERYPKAVMGITSRSLIPLSPFPIELTPEQAFKKHFFEYGLLDYGPTGVIIRRDTFESVGGFSGKRYVGDQECWFKIASAHNIIELPPSLTFWRQHGGQEFRAGLEMIDDGYFAMNLPLLIAVLERDECPLTKEEKCGILKKQRKEYSRNLIKYFLRTGNLRKTVRFFSDLRLSPLDSF